MATVSSYDTASGKRWEVRYRTPERTTTRKRGFTSKRQAQDYAATVEVEKMTGSYVAPSAGRVLLGDVAEKWMTSKVNLSPSTAARYRSSLDVHVLPTFGQTPLIDVTRERLRNWVANMAENLSASTTRTNVLVLSQILDQAVEDSRIVSNPCDGLDLPKMRHKDRRYLTFEQVDLLAKGEMIRTCGSREGAPSRKMIFDETGF